MFDSSQLIFVVISIICFIPAIVVHEVAHGLMAYKLGDPTAKSQGRLSFNPIKHIDPFGTVILPLMMAISGLGAFGYAKPVPYNPRYFKNIKVGEVLTGLAGPASNLVMALVATGVGGGLIYFYNSAPDIMYYVMYFLYYFIIINLCLMFFNLLPIPPLDGSSIIFPFIPKKYHQQWYQVQRYAMPILIILIIVIPYISDFNPISIYIRATAYNLTDLLVSFW
ncbi:MAG: site-2 protease family protein [Coriobacteriales bacterium]|nr:site-2 protease family protein [Coriobacteriales bacterium]